MSISTAVILAAGMGTRLSSVTKDKIPKGFLEINGQTLIERSINKLRSVGIRKIYIVTGHLNTYYDKLCEKYKFIKTRHNRFYRKTGSMASLAVLEDEISEDFILLESDIIYEVYALIETINYKEDDCVLLSGRTNSGDECYVQVKENNLYKISKNIEDIDEVYGELVGISKISIGLFKEIIRQYKRFKADLFLENYKDKYDYENAIFDSAKERKIGYLKLNNLIWGEIDDESHLNRIKNIIIPKLENKNIKEEITK
ncbi:phosphocholine cytidylyltransferase family protein [Clostridium sp. BJN0001]|uniref:phosphocholine cytidylyltransferase family protein n=1 Tax=Clostridium sp. BJN0001 TaxID=2930219 RepID=UPI001FCFF431|nr:phosphocholine cytidylyltransferase family protein [Clostridium sp. BJN0001]